MSPRSCDVRVADSVTTARPFCDLESVVEGSRSADRDEVWVDCGRRETRCVGAVVARRRHDHDAGLPCPFERGGQRIFLVRKLGTATEREVEDADVEFIGIVDYPVDACDDVVRVGGAVTSSDLYRHDPGVGRDTFEFLRCIDGVSSSKAALVARDDAGHERAVTIGVDISSRRIIGFTGQIDHGDELAVGIETVDLRHSGVDDRHVDAGSGVSGFPHLPCADLVDEMVKRTGLELGSIDVLLERHRADDGRRIIRSIDSECQRPETENGDGREEALRTLWRPPRVRAPRCGRFDERRALLERGAGPEPLPTERRRLDGMASAHPLAACANEVARIGKHIPISPRRSAEGLHGDLRSRGPHKQNPTRFSFPNGSPPTRCVHRVG